MKSHLMMTTMLAAGMVLPLAASAQGTQPDQAAQANTSEVVVTGFRSSLQKSLNLKKQAIVVRDSIVAEDIGKFPEANVAESLQRVPGVIMTRDESSAEGQRISIRGLPSDFSVTTLNGAPVHTTSAANIGGSSRDFNYDVFPSELFGRVDFYKTPLAELTEGGIGGLVDLQTPRPFDNPKRTLRYALSDSYNTMSKHNDPNAFLLFSNTWGDWGFLIGAAHSESVNTRSGFEATGGYNSSFRASQSPVKGNFAFALDYDDPRANLGSYTKAQIDNALLPRIYRFYGAQNDRTRDGLVSSIQYKHDNIDISLDALTSDLKNQRDEIYFGLFVRNGKTTNRAAPAGQTGHNGMVPTNVHIDPNSNLLTGTFANTTYNDGTTYTTDETKFNYLALNGKWSLSDTFSLSGQVSGSDSAAFTYNSGLSAQIFGVDSTIDYSSDHVYPSLSSPVSYTNRANFDGFGISTGWAKEVDKERQARFAADWDYHAPFGFDGHLKAGMSYVTTSKGINKRNGTSGATAHLNALGATALRGAMVTTLPIDNLDMGSGWPHAWATYSRGYVMSEFNPLTYDTAATFTPAQSFTAEEQITTGFIQSDFIGQLFSLPLRVNAGVRFSDTKTLIDNYKQQGASLTYGPNHESGGYNNTLPSLSAAYDLSDKLTWRASWGKTITRASLSIIAAQTVIPNPFDNTATSGNPNLKPELSSNFDTSLEWYFDKGGLLSAALFRKDLTNATVANSKVVTFGSLGLPDTALGAIFQDSAGHVDPNMAMTLKTYTNAAKQKLQGYELAYQQNFRFLPEPFDGLGALASFTHIDPFTPTGTPWKSTAGQVVEVNAVPEYAYSFTGYYEKGPLGIRFSYNYKGKYIHQDTPTNNGDDLIRWRAGRGYLDGNISYKISDRLELRVDALNLSNTLGFDYFEDVTGQYGTGEKTRMDYAKYDGRTIKVGIRGKF